MLVGHRGAPGAVEAIVALGDLLRLKEDKVGMGGTDSAKSLYNVEPTAWTVVVVSYRM